MSAQRNLLDDLVSGTSSVTLHLYLTVILLAIFARFLVRAPDTLVVALLSCVSMPATYSLSYQERQAPKFVTYADGSLLRDHKRGLLALLTSYAFGFLVFVAISGMLDFAIFTFAFAVVLAAKLILSTVIRKLGEEGFDADSPVIVLLSSSTVASLLSILLMFLFR